MNYNLTDERIEKLAGKYGTTLYIYDRDVIRENSRLLKDCVYPGASVYYAMKCNPLVGICRTFKEEGLGIETASKGEIVAALKA